MADSVRKERRSLQASLRLAAQKTDHGRDSPDPTPATVEADQRKLVEEEQRIAHQEAMAAEAREMADLAISAEVHQSVLAAEVEVALRSPKHKSSGLLSPVHSPTDRAGFTPADFEFRSPRSRRSSREPLMSPTHTTQQTQPAIQMQSADEILARIATLEAEQQNLSATAEENKQAAEQNKQALDKQGREIKSSSRKPNVPDVVVDPDAIVAAAIEKVREEVLGEIDGRVESTVEQDIRSVSKVLVDRLNALTVQLENERAANAEVERKAAEDAAMFRQRLLQLEQEEKRRKEKDKDGCCLLQ